MEEEKKETGTQHFKLWLFAVIITMIFILGRITTYADETDTVTDILTSGEDVEHDYEYVIMQHGQSDTYLVLVLSSSGCVVSGTSEGATVTGCINAISTGMSGLQGGLLTEYCSYDNETNKSAKTFTHTLDEHQTIVYSSTDLLDSNNKLVFHQTPLKKQGGKTLVETIPQQMGVQMGVILPTAVFCLALLISLVVLPTKLRIFLR